jgi:hypothetical protein
MANEGRAGGSRRDTGQPLGPAWQRYRGIYDVPGRLSRSATLALILSPIGIILISVTRLLIISDYNPVTASAVVSSGGYVDTLFGTVIPLVPIFAPYLALILLFFDRIIASLLTFLAAAFMSPVVLSRPSALRLIDKDWYLVFHHNLLVIIVMVLLALIFMLLLFAEIAGIGFDVGVKTVAVVACLLLIPFVVSLYPLPLNNRFYSELIRQPWMPPETIVLTSGQKTVGYVLSDNGTWVEVLMDDTRTVNYYRSAEVASRKICQIGPTPPGQPFIALFPAGLHAPTRTPLCGVSPTGRLPSSMPSSAIQMKDEPSIRIYRMGWSASHGDRRRGKRWSAMG